MRIRSTGVYISILLLMLGVHAMGYAQSCGDTVVGTVTLQADLICPTGHGLLVGNGATLDCAGHTITGGDAAGQYGIYVRDVSDAVVQNCIVEHFEVGIRLRGATNIAVQNSISRDNPRYGMEITQSSTGALIQGNTVKNNSNEGIHVSGPIDLDAAHQILGNIVDGNQMEGIYLLNSNANTIADNTIQNHGTAGIYVKNSHHNGVQGNVLTSDPIQLVFGSQFNVLSDNTIIGQRLKLHDSSNNTIYNMSIQGQDGRPNDAYDFNGSSDNAVIDSEAIDPLDLHIKAENGSRNNAFIRFSALPRLRCFDDRTSSVTVTDPDGNPVKCRRRSS